MTLNGWQRLWVLVSLLYFAPVSLIGYISFQDVPLGYPELEELTLVLGGNDLPVCQDISQRNFGGPQRQEQMETVTGADLKNIFRCKLVKAQKDAIFKGRLRVVLIAIGAWVAPVVLVYILGLGIVWVRRGFDK